MSPPVPAPDPDLLADALAQPEAHPDDPSARAGVRHVQTHISHVFLTGERVYKLRKPVDLGFLDFSTLARRNADCLREVALNRRLAPDVYLGVAPVLRAGGGAHLGPVGETLADDDGLGHTPEHCVVMRRLPEGDDARARLAAGRLRAEHLDAVAARVAAFHAGHGLGTPAPFSAEEWLERITAPVAENFETLAGADVDRALFARARDAARRFEAGHAGRFERRRREGRAVDAHGDLHLEHVWFEDDSLDPLLIDCIEFSERLRRIDAASEVAFLAMDLAYRGRPEWAARFLRRYARERDDYDLYSVVDYYVAYRAGVRAKVAALAAGEEEIPAEQRRAAGESARRHLALAADALAPPGPGALLLVCGTVGAGKSSLAERVADAARGVVIGSDRVRKRLAGMAPDERGGATRGLYDEAHTERTYAGLLERAAPVLDSGRVAVLDATFARARHRDAARAFAAARGAPARLLEARCAPEEARARLAQRRREGGDPSDAGPELLEASQAGFEPLDAWPAAERAAVATDAADWPRGLPALLAELLPGAIAAGGGGA